MKPATCLPYASKGWCSGRDSAGRASEPPWALAVVLRGPLSLENVGRDALVTRKQQLGVLTHKTSWLPLNLYQYYYRFDFLWRSQKVIFSAADLIWIFNIASLFSISFYRTQLSWFQSAKCVPCLKQSSLLHHGEGLQPAPELLLSFPISWALICLSFLTLSFPARYRRSQETAYFKQAIIWCQLGF